MNWKKNKKLSLSETSTFLPVQIKDLHVVHSDTHAALYRHRIHGVVLGGAADGSIGVSSGGARSEKFDTC